MGAQSKQKFQLPTLSGEKFPVRIVLSAVAWTTRGRRAGLLLKNASTSLRSISWVPKACAHAVVGEGTMLEEHSKRDTVIENNLGHSAHPACMIWDTIAVTEDKSEDPK